MQNFEDLKRQAIEAVLTQAELSAAPNGMCLYRGPNGTHCVVGHFIRLAGGDLERVYEGEGAERACDSAGLAYLDDSEMDQLTLLRQTHDMCVDGAWWDRDVSAFRERFRKALGMEAT